MSGARRWASYFVGRAFSTRLELPDEPVWEPLEFVARTSRESALLPSFHEGEFMYMAMVRRPRNTLTIHLYKHFDTRLYLNLDDAGNAYAFRGPVSPDSDGSGGRYQQYRSLRHAVRHVELWLFDADPPLYRSFPPSEWPPDVAAAGKTIEK
jgi:hypothetical protein